MNIPTWEELRSRGYMLVDLPQRRLAIYPNVYGVVVIASQLGESPMLLTALYANEVQAAQEALATAHAQAVTVLQEIDAAKATRVVLQRAKRAVCRH